MSVLAPCTWKRKGDGGKKNKRTFIPTVGTLSIPEQTSYLAYCLFLFIYVYIKYININNKCVHMQHTSMYLFHISVPYLTCWRNVFPRLYWCMLAGAENNWNNETVASCIDTMIVFLTTIKKGNPKLLKFNIDGFFHSGDMSILTGSCFNAFPLYPTYHRVIYYRAALMVAEFSSQCLSRIKVSFATIYPDLSLQVKTPHFLSLSPTIQCHSFLNLANHW